ncbi:FG-GAP-like repeat-containing protein [Catellatospora aurea]|uniref:FG-GAP-like repeat-containing protein n=1 Tax=Catellatospora aurea TaxID=1337874 RepID=A0ABW2H9W0_9ACTN
MTVGAVLSVLSVGGAARAGASAADGGVAAGPTYSITADSQVDLFVQAVSVRDAVIKIAGNVNLNLSGKQDLAVAPGVQIIGDQSTYPKGPRLFTSTNPTYLFDIGDEWAGPSDNVRISGIRFDGGTPQGTVNSVAVSVRSSINVEIDHSEFYGWGVGVEVVDPWGNRITLANASTVHIHDNYMHDLQVQFGYGVVTGKGASALIEENVFYNNRHSIASDGREGSGYLLYRNLILANSGINADEQQIDMHAVNHCGDGHWNCGPAGEYMDIRYNTIQHVEGRSFLLRGDPYHRADVAYNVFALPQQEALHQNEGNDMLVWGNTFSLNTYNDAKYCDFDADGQTDRFMATGITWWYKSSLTTRWTYLNQSTKRAGSLTLGNVTGDSRCDIRHDGVTFDAGMNPTRGTDVLWRKVDGTNPLVWQVNTVGQVPASKNPGSALAGSDQILGTGDFDGDGDSDVITKSTDGKVHRVLMDNGLASSKDTQPTWIGPILAGVGDFDGDGADDVLWRRAGGRLEIWFSGMAIRSAAPTFNNSGAPVADSMQINGVGDFNGDGYADILWRDAQGDASIWYMNGGRFVSSLTHPGTDPFHVFQVAAVGDFNADHRADILWRSTDGRLVIWFSGQEAGKVFPTYKNLPGWLASSTWHIKNAGDFNADGRADILWHNTANGQVFIWFMSGGTWLGEAFPGNDSGGVWKIEGLLPIRNSFANTPPPPSGITVVVPNLTGLTETEASQALRDRNLLTGLVGTVIDCGLLDVVAEQTPNPGTVVPAGTRIHIDTGVVPAPPASCQ